MIQGFVLRCPKFEDRVQRREQRRILEFASQLVSGAPGIAQWRLGKGEPGTRPNQLKARTGTKQHGMTHDIWKKKSMNICIFMWHIHTYIYIYFIICISLYI